MQRRHFLGGAITAPLWSAGTAVRILYHPGGGPEAAAAVQLGRYVRELTGVAPEVIDDAQGSAGPDAALTMLVGRTQRTRRLLQQGSLQDPAGKHPEAYLARSIPGGAAAGTEIAFLGGSPLATSYAVYHYLERYCAVGFFWDGDHVPRLQAMPARGIAIEARPHFDDRFYFNGCLDVYTAPWWEWDDWQRYIDWMVKNRFNVMDQSAAPGYNVVWQKVWKRFGVDVAPETWSGPPFDTHTAFGVEPTTAIGWREGRAEMRKRIFAYARSLGLRIVLPSLPAVVPPEFLRAHPAEKVLRVKWADFPERLYLDPRGRMYHDVGKAFLDELIGEFGTDHLYGLENYGELSVNEPEEVKAAIRRQIARANFRVIDEVDPRGIALISAWTYMSREWTREAIREQLEGLPADRIRVEDLYGEQHPFYKQTDYFFGLPWQFSVVHSYGGETHLHGNMPLLEKQVRAVATDPKASRCKGFMMMNEASGHNHFYFSFMAKLAWNPAEVDLKSYTAGFARARYGEAAAPAMTRALEQLLGSVLGTDDVRRPLYWKRLLGDSPLSMSPGAKHIPKLARALRFALQAKDAARANPLYLHDLNDICRQYLAEIFNAAVLRLTEAFRAMDHSAFGREAGRMEAALESIEQLLAADSYYWLSTQIEKGRRLPAAPPDIDRRARNIVTVWAWAPTLRDYDAHDYYEVVRWYYRPRVKAFVKDFEQRLADLQREPDHGPEQSRLGKEYARIEREFVDKGYPPIEHPPDPPKVVRLVESALSMDSGIAPR
jgi:alpha-N-acetylglucosaminidase